MTLVIIDLDKFFLIIMLACAVAWQMLRVEMEGIEPSSNKYYNIFLQLSLDLIFSLSLKLDKIT